MKTVKTQRLRWYGHMKRMGEEKAVEKVTKRKRDFRRGRGRPKSPEEREDKKAKNLQLEGENPGSEVVEENHKEAKTSEALEWERRKM